MLNSKTLTWNKKIYHVDKAFLSSSKIFLLNIFKVASQYLFNVVILFDTVSYLEFNLKLKIDQKILLSKTQRKFFKNI